MSALPDSVPEGSLGPADLISGVRALGNSAIDALTQWHSPSAAQSELKDRFVALLRSDINATQRTVAPDHITCGALVVDQYAEHVLMNLHAKAGIWVAFGGHCDPTDSTPLEVARRELIEESGLANFDLDPEIAQLDVHPVDFCRPHGEVNHLDIRFLARASRNTSLEITEESEDLRWFAYDQVPTEEDSMRALIAIARSRYART